MQPYIFYEFHNNTLSAVCVQEHTRQTSMNCVTLLSTILDINEKSSLNSRILNVFTGNSVASKSQ